MLSVHESSSSLPSNVQSGPWTKNDPPWLATSRSSTFLSTTGSHATSIPAHSNRERDLPKWRAFLAGRSRSGPQASTPSNASMHARGHSSPSEPQLERAFNTSPPESRSLTASEVGGSNKSSYGVRTSFLRTRWAPNRQSRDRRSAHYSVAETSGEPGCEKRLSAKDSSPFGSRLLAFR